MKTISLLLFVLVYFLSPAAGESQKIAFERDNGIWIVDLSGQSAKRLASGNLPEISPDGARVAFTTDEPSKTTPVRHIAIVEIATGKVTNLKSVPSDNSFGPVWSPDSKMLLFSVYLDKDWQLAMVNSDDTSYKIVKKTEKENQHCGAPAWASDGKSFFCHDLDSIYRIGLDGKTLHQWQIHSIVEHGDMNSNSRMVLSPDGQALLMDIDMDEDHNRENWDGPPPALWVLRLNEEKATRISDPGFFAWEPFWLNADEYLFMSQGEKEDTTSVYRGSLTKKGFTRVIQNARTPSASR